jgi:hypothetical protein
MRDPKMMTTKECADEIIRMVRRDSTKEEIIERVRRSRSKLGAVLDRLECFQFRPDELEHLREQVEAIAFEVDNAVVLMHGLSE